MIANDMRKLEARMAELLVIAKDEGIEPSSDSARHFCDFVRAFGPPAALFLLDDGLYKARWLTPSQGTSLLFHADGAIKAIHMQLQAGDPSCIGISNLNTKMRSLGCWTSSDAMMQFLVGLDVRLQERVDSITGRLAERDVQMPLVLREWTVADAATLLVLLVACMQSTAAGFIGLFLIGLSLPVGYGLFRRWKSLDADAKRDWTEALAEKYSRMALERRERGQAFRFTGLMLLPTFLLCTLSLLAMVGWDSFMLAILLRSVVILIGAYLESSIPIPPRRRRHGWKLSEAGA